jgi:FAD/FMN-containing dehydrogenase
MAGIDIVSARGAKLSLAEATLERLRAQLRGPLLRPGDEGYDGARRIWNAMIDRRPALALRCAGVGDIIAGVRFARENDLLLAVRGGGHNIAGNAVCEGGFLLDLSALRSVVVDATTRRASVEPGATLADFDHEAQVFGLATPLGINSTTGVAGLTLGGGFGWLTRRYGLTVDNLIAADVVTAEAKLLRASADANPDLFWAIRGGGGNFGVAARFEFGLHPVGPQVLAGLIVFPLAEAAQVLRRYRDYVETTPDELSVWCVLRQAPPLPFLPAAAHGKEILALAVFYAGDEAEGRRLIEPLRGFGRRAGEHVGLQPYEAWQRTFDPLLTPGARNYWKSHNFAVLSDGAIDVLTAFAGRLPSPETEIFVGQLGGQASRVPPGATAYANRDAKFVLNVHGRWRDTADDARCIAWAREFFRAATPHALGSVYVNFLTADEADRLPAAYGGGFRRLVEVKRKYDPTNLFRMNQNVSPSAPAPAA